MAVNNTNAFYTAFCVTLLYVRSPAQVSVAKIKALVGLCSFLYVRDENLIPCLFQCLKAAVFCLLWSLPSTGRACNSRPSLSHTESFSFSGLRLPLWGEPHLLPCVYFGTTKIIQCNFPTFKVSQLATKIPPAANSPLPCKVTYLRGPRIKTQTS